MVPIKAIFFTKAKKKDFNQGEEQFL